MSEPSMTMTANAPCDDCPLKPVCAVYKSSCKKFNQWAGLRPWKDTPQLPTTERLKNIMPASAATQREMEYQIQSMF